MNKNIFFYKVLISFCVFLTPILVNANQVEVMGSIVETACSIDVGSRNQDIEMDSLPISKISRDGFGPDKDFTIKLMNCVLENPNTEKDWTSLRVTFDGQHDSDLFNVVGQARGIGLQISNANGEIVIPGKAMSRHFLSVDPTQKLNFKIRAMSNKENLVSGKYHSFLRFKIDYE